MEETLMKRGCGSNLLYFSVGYDYSNVHDVCLRRLFALCYHHHTMRGHLSPLGLLPPLPSQRHAKRGRSSDSALLADAIRLVVYELTAATAAAVVQASPFALAVADSHGVWAGRPTRRHQVSLAQVRPRAATCFGFDSGDGGDGNGGGDEKALLQDEHHGEALGTVEKIGEVN